MDPHDKSELILAAVILGIYIAFVLARHTCNIIPGLCTVSWVIFGAIFIGAVIFIMSKIFGA